MTTWPLGVFASMNAGFGVQLSVAHELGVPTIHLHTPTAELRTEAKASEFLTQLKEFGIEISCVFAGFEGESYADIPTVEQTVGLVPKATRAARLVELFEIADFAKLLGVQVVGLHLGFVPHDQADLDYAALLEVTRQVCDHCKQNGQNVHLETGQEPANVLHEFLTNVERDNLFINFDPANMILYGCGEPLEALEVVAPFVRSVHCKDATWSTEPSKTWGQETALGQGDVDFKKFLQILANHNYTGPLTIEREIPQDPERQKQEIGQALDLLKKLMN